MKWPTVYASVFKQIGHNVTYLDSEEDLWKKILIDGIPLNEVLHDKFNYTSFFDTHYVLINRIFDDRVKGNFITKFSISKYFNLQKFD